MRNDSPHSVYDVLPNKLGLSNSSDVGLEEFRGFLRADIKFERELDQINNFDWRLLSEIHRVALGHLYDFAGNLRSVNISKGGFLFPVAQHLDSAINQFELDFLKSVPRQITDPETLISITARIHAEILFIHPFREGNGRTARLFVNLIALKKGFDRFNFECILDNRMSDYIFGVQAASDQNYEPMIQLFKNLVQPKIY